MCPYNNPPTRPTARRTTRSCFREPGRHSCPGVSSGRLAATPTGYGVSEPGSLQWRVVHCVSYSYSSGGCPRCKLDEVLDLNPVQMRSEPTTAQSALGGVNAIPIDQVRPGTYCHQPSSAESVRLLAVSGTKLMPAYLDPGSPSPVRPADSPETTFESAGLSRSITLPRVAVTLRTLNLCSAA